MKAFKQVLAWLILSPLIVGGIYSIIISWEFVLIMSSVVILAAALFWALNTIMLGD